MVHAACVCALVRLRGGGEKQVLSSHRALTRSFISDPALISVHFAVIQENTSHCQVASRKRQRRIELMNIYFIK